MFAVMTLQQKYGMDESMEAYELVHDSKDAYYKMYNETLINNIDQLNNVIQQIKQSWVPSSENLIADRCNSKTCSYFTEITGLTAKDFYIYNTFVAQIVDNMISTVDGEVPTMGFSLTVLEGFPKAHDVYIELQKLVYEVQATGSFNVYSAITMVGFHGYFFLNHENAHAMVGITQDFGQLYEVPKYDEQTFFDNQQSITDLELKGHISPFQRLLDFCQDSVVASYGTLYDYIIPQKGELSYSNDYLISYQEQQQSELNGQYSSNKDGYKKTIEQTHTIYNVQTSLRYNESVYLDSDYRMITQERNFNSSSISETTSASSIYSTLSLYPQRQATTMVVVSAGLNEVSEQKARYETCTSVFDASNSVVSCLSQPPAPNAASITCSIIIIIATIGVWIWGCMVEKKMQKEEDVQKALEQE